MNLLPKKIYELRKYLNLTQAELGERIGVTRKTVHQWEAAVGMPRSANIKEICIKFNIPDEYFFNPNMTAAEAVYAGRQNCTDEQCEQTLSEEDIKKAETKRKVHKILKIARVSWLSFVFAFLALVIFVLFMAYMPPKPIKNGSVASSITWHIERPLWIVLMVLAFLIFVVTPVCEFIRSAKRDKELAALKEKIYAIS